MELAFNYIMHPYDEADREGASIITTFGITHNGMLIGSYGDCMSRTTMAHLIAYHISKLNLA